VLPLSLILHHKQRDLAALAFSCDREKLEDEISPLHDLWCIMLVLTAASPLGSILLICIKLAQCIEGHQYMPEVVGFRPVPDCGGSAGHAGGASASQGRSAFPIDGCHR